MMDQLEHFTWYKGSELDFTSSDRPASLPVRLPLLILHKGTKGKGTEEQHLHFLPTRSILGYCLVQSASLHRQAMVGAYQF